MREREFVVEVNAEQNGGMVQMFICMHKYLYKFRKRRNYKYIYGNPFNIRRSYNVDLRILNSNRGLYFIFPPLSESRKYVISENRFLSKVIGTSNQIVPFI